MAEINSDITIVLGETPTQDVVPNPRNAHIAGGNAILFRYANTSERALASLGTYSYAEAASPSPAASPDSVYTEYSWPNQPADSIVDLDNVTLYVSDGLLQYYTEEAVDTEADAGINRLQTTSLVFVSNSVSDRDAVFLDRDCKVGDVVIVSVGATSLQTTITSIVADDTGAYTILVLKDDIPAAIRAAVSVDLSLYIVADGVVVPEVREESPGDFNYTYDADGINIATEITMYDSTWTDEGVQQALTLTEGELIVNYRAWVDTVSDGVYECEDYDELDDIPGVLHPANPLKWGVYMALLNSDGVSVKYTAVANPDSATSWSAMLDWLGDDTDIYSLVPLTSTQAIWTLYTTYVTTQRAAGQPLCVWVAPDFTSAISLYANLDATISEYGSTGNYTVITAEDGQFITDGVAIGDTVDFEFDTDAWGRTTYSSGTVAEIYSEQSLRIATSASTAIAVAERIRITRPITAASVTTALQALAVTLDNAYVRLVWPDVLTTTHGSYMGAFIAAAVAGGRSGVYPHQSLTNKEVVGVDSNTRMLLLNVTQKNTLVNSGVWVVNVNSTEDVVTRKGVTTSQTTTAEYRNEAVISNIDGIELDARRAVARHEGTSNVNSTIIRHVKVSLRELFRDLGNAPTVELGPRIFEGVINSVNASETTPGNVVVDYSVTVPVAFDALEIVQQIEVGL